MGRVMPCTLRRMKSKLLPTKTALCFNITLLIGLAPVQAGLQPVDPTQFFISPDRPATLQLRLEPATSEAIPYSITGYWGREVVTAKVAPRDGHVELPLKLRQGYYEIAFPQQKQTFGICVAPEPKGPVDPFFCIDGALSWLERREPPRDPLARILKRAGIAISRERLTWGAVQPGSGQWDAQAATNYETMRQTYARHGVRVLEMFHDAPGWMGVGESNPYPANLLEAGRCWEEIRRRWQPTWAALEIWNEPDIHFGNRLPADQYVPVAKAVAFALGNATPTVPLVGGVFTDVCSDEYRQACTRNGLLDHLDVVSFHTYFRTDAMEAMVQTYRSWLKASGKEAMPLWITESGRPWPRGTERPPKSKCAHSALDITMKAIEARACGVAAYFPFVYVYYEEREHNFAMMGKELTPLRAMAAYVQAISALGHKPYRGDLKVSDPAIQRARVFGNNSQSVVVLYTGKSGSSVKLDLPFTRLQGIDGRTVSAKEPGQIPVTDGLVYAWCDSAKIADMLRTDTTATRLYAISRQAPPRRPKPSPIVMQPVIDLKKVTASTAGYAIPADLAARFPLGVRIHNLGEHAATVVLSVSSVVQDPVGKDSRAPRRVAAEHVLQLAASSHVETSWELDVGEIAGPQRACTLTVFAKAERIEPISPLAIDMSITRNATTTAP